MIASLPMYARPELVGAHDRYWQLIRNQLAAAGIDSPEQLSHHVDEWSVWQHPDLVLSQTCGLPYRTRLRGNVSLVGTPDYGIEGCPPGYYRSALVVRASDERTGVEDFAESVFAFNGVDSQSGFAAAYWHVEPLGFWFGNQFCAGAHLRSAQAVAAGRADIASLDAVSWRLMQQHQPFARELRVLASTEPTPGLPLITSLDIDAAAVFGAVERAIAELDEPDRQLLGITGIVQISEADYLAVRNPGRGADS